MKFTRRHDLDPQTRIDIVKHVWIHQGIYGKMTQIAQAYKNTQEPLDKLTFKGIGNPLIFQTLFISHSWLVLLGKSRKAP